MSNYIPNIKSDVHYVDEYVKLIDFRQYKGFWESVSDISLDNYIKYLIKELEFEQDVLNIDENKDNYQDEVNTLYHHLDPYVKDKFNKDYYEEWENIEFLENIVRDIQESKGKGVKRKEEKEGKEGKENKEDKKYKKELTINTIKELFDETIQEFKFARIPKNYLDNFNRDYGHPIEHDINKFTKNRYWLNEFLLNITDLFNSFLNNIENRYEFDISNPERKQMKKLLSEKILSEIKLPEPELKKF